MKMAQQVSDDGLANLKLAQEKDTKHGYDQWAENYTTDMTLWKWTCPRDVVNIALKHVEKDGKVLDCGCGTGLVGQSFSDEGYRNVTGFDFSEDMMALARKRGVYSAFVQGDLSKPLPFE